MILSDIEFNFDENSPLNGAFTHMQIAYKKENISDKILKIRASSTVQNLEYPVIKRDESSDYYWCSRGGEPNSWYEVDFLMNRFYLESYVIRACSWDFFEKWQVLGSDDGKHYYVVDNVTEFKKPEPWGEHLFNFVCKFPKASIK